ncbi:MAG: CCA tRNA nucleotidyltransferase [Dehalococcoidia bacterium]
MSKKSRDLMALMPPQISTLLQYTGRLARERNECVYLVGGAVRDLLLGQSSSDIDLVVEGKAISLARQIAYHHDLYVKPHPRFGTAKLSWGDYTFDLVTARSEVYRRPGALPEVQHGTIYDDLARRDFTINAMAVSLAPNSLGELLDPHGGQSDLENKLIRILHPGSFVDDPTRILRAIRYEQRLGFHLESSTERLLRRDSDRFDTVSGERLWREIELILQEREPEEILLTGDQAGIIQRLCPVLKIDLWLADKFSQARQIVDDQDHLPSVYLSMLSYRLEKSETESFIGRFKMPGWAASIVRNTLRIHKSLDFIRSSEIFRSQIYNQLRYHKPEVIKAASLCSESPLLRTRLNLYLQVLRYIEPELKGEDLIMMGVTPGEHFGEILRQLQEAKIDRKINTREEEEALVRGIL